MQQIAPITVRRLKMLWAQEHSFGPMHRQITHEHSDQDCRATFRSSPAECFRLEVISYRLEIRVRLFRNVCQSESSRNAQPTCQTKSGGNAQTYVAGQLSVR